MTARSRICSMAGLAIAGALAFVTSASAQTFYVDSYAGSYADPYPVAVAPGSVYVAPAPVIAAPTIVRERTVVVRRPAYVPPPVFGAPVPYYGYAGDPGYVVAGW